jgi:crossover junction endodeoxyribonuclease RusA
VECIFYPPDRRKRDLDNHLKALLDSCTLSGLWEDDSLIDQLTLYRGVVVKTGIIRMEINLAGPLMPYSIQNGTHL